MISVHDASRVDELALLAGFRQAVYDCLLRRAEALFELGDAQLWLMGRWTVWWGCR